MEDDIESIVQELQEYYGKELTDKQLDIYLRLLADVDSSCLRQGADYYMQTFQYFPKVAELIMASKRFSPLPTPAPENYEYWKAQQTFNDVLAGKLPDSALDKYEQYLPKVEVKDEGRQHAL